MKKNIKKSLFIFSILFLICVLDIGCEKNNKSESLSMELGIDLSQGEIESDLDTHEGPLGDGIKLKVVHFKNDSITDEIKKSSVWKPLPLSEELAIIVYGGLNHGCYIESLIASDENGMTIPKIDKGYYYFKDRHFESTDSQSEVGILDRPSYNFTIAMYDSDSRILYFCEVDT